MDEDASSAYRLAAASSPIGAGGGASRWLLGPVPDLLLICNLWWPIVAVGVWRGGQPAHEELHFLQIYFVTTPHRWLTLALVWGDPRQRRIRGGACMAIAAAAVLVCGGMWFFSGTFLCLAIIDYLWNVWHFAAQHHGVYRLYTRGQQPGTRLGTRLERIALRGVIIYVMLRAAGWTWQWASLEHHLAAVDLGIAWGMVALWVRSAWAGRSREGSVLYLASVLLLFGALLAAVHCGRRDWVLPLATASALFHACEYLAVCAWSVQRSGPDAGWLTRLAPDAASVLLCFIAACGAAGWWLNARHAELWMGANLAAAFIHYAYDGLIWRSAARGRPRAAVVV